MASDDRRTAEEVIRRLGLVPLPGEGGFFRETYRSDVSIAGSSLPVRYQSTDRASATAIYYLLTPDTYSALHRLKSDEIYFFHAGDPIAISLITADGVHSRTILSNRLDEGDQCQLVVPAGTWQGSRVITGGTWGLVGTAVSPGFEFSDCELALLENIISWPRETRQAVESLLAPHE